MAGGTQTRPRPSLLLRPSGLGRQLAAGYAIALAVHDTEASEAPLSAQEAQLLRQDTFVVPAGKLSEWVLDDHEGEASDVCG